MPFSKSNRPKLPDSYFNFETQPVSVVPPSAGATVAIPIVHDWGPFEETHLVGSFAEFQSVYGYSDDTPGYLAVKEAFLGEGLNGRYGAGGVLVYRFGDSGAKKAKKTLENTSEAAITLTAKYEGTLGNDLRVTVRTNANDSEKQDLVLLDGTVVLETYTYAKTNTTLLGEEINAHSNYITASVSKTGVVLKTVTASAFTEGDDGAEPVAEDWTKVLDAIAVEPFGVFAPYDLTETSIIKSIEAWVQELNEERNKRFMAVVGGKLGQTLTEANTLSGELADPEVINVGVGKYISEDLGPEGEEIELSPAQLAPRIAGILAAKGEYAALTYARLAGLAIKEGPTDAEIAEAYDGGTLVLARDDDPEAPTHIKVGHTTWTETDAASEPEKPYTIYREPKYVRTMHGLQTDLTAYFRSQILGLRPINDDTRDAVVSEAKKLLDERQRLGVIQSGWKVGIDQDPPPSDDDEFVAIVVELKFGRALKQVYVSMKIG